MLSSPLTAPTISAFEVGVRALRDLLAPPEASERYRAFAPTYRDDPVAFAHDCIRWREGQGLAPYQEEILAMLPVKRRVAVYGPHGLGKTTLSALLVLWYALTRDADLNEDWKVATTAGSWRQLIRYLWPEIHKWAMRLRWDKIGRNPFDERREFLVLGINLGRGQAFPVASDVPALIEGAHADQLLYVYDEAKSIHAGTFDASEGAFSGGKAMGFACSTPGDPSGRFYDICSRKAGTEDWWVRHVTMQEAIAAGRMDADWAEARRRLWGEESAVYQNRILGQFATSGTDGVIPLSWIERANERWRLWNDQQRERKRQERAQYVPPKVQRIGADIAWTGEDKTVFALLVEKRIVSELRVYAHQDPMATTGLLAGLLKANPGSEAVVDVIGIGAGVVSRLREQKLPVVAFNAGERSEAKDRSGELGFVNRRSAALWNVREMLDPSVPEEDALALPPDDFLTGDLTAPKWKTTSGGKIEVESKEEIRKRLDRSTDEGDSVMQLLEPKPKRGVFFA